LLDHCQPYAQLIRVSTHWEKLVRLHFLMSCDSLNRMNENQFTFFAHWFFVGRWDGSKRLHISIVTLVA